MIRAGISIGDATPSDGDYFGIPVVEAARLCDRAGGGQILASEMVAHLAGSRGHEFRPLGSLELKGLPEPLATVEVPWEPLGEGFGVLPLQAPLQEVPPGGFVGREAESERLAELLEEARGGERRLALLAGEPGIGKTRLATHTAIAARRDDAAVLYGRCTEELAIPYGPWVEALTHYVEHGPERVIRAHVERHGGDLARIVPALSRRIPDLPPPAQTDPETERYLLWAAVAALLREASEREPLTLLLDDLHWTDKPTLHLLKHLLTHGSGLRALIIGTYRESDIGRGHPLFELLADLNKVEGVDRISLTGLDEPQTRELMEHAAGHELDETGIRLAGDLFRETDGNPFYTGEVLRHLTESGAIQQAADGIWTVEGDLMGLGLPQSVREVVGRRVERLGGPTLKALSAAAVIGRSFDVDLLTAITDEDSDELLDLLEGAATASVVVESGSVPGRFSFSHALINHILYEELGTTRLARMHRRVGEALEIQLGEEPGTRVSELAHHWAKASGAADSRKPISYARQAGERALAELAPDEALRWFSQALDLEGRQPERDPAERCDLLIGLGTAQLQVGEAAFRETLLEAAGIASDLGDGERAARAALANNRGQASDFGALDGERLSALDRALELCGPDDLARSARLLALQAMELQADHDHERRQALADEALARARQAEDPRTLGYVLQNTWNAIWSPDTVGQRAELADELMGVADEAGDPSLRFWAANMRMHTDAERFELESMDEGLARERDLADQLGHPSLRWYARFNNVCGRMAHGDLSGAEELAEEAFRIAAEAEQPDAMLVYGSQISNVRVYQGRGGEVVDLLAAAAEESQAIPAFRASVAATYCWLGRADEAAPIVEEAARDRFDHVPRNQIYTTAIALYAEAAAQIGDQNAAAILYELIEPWSDQMVWNGGNCHGDALTYLGLMAATLRRDELADQHFSAACELQADKGMSLWGARAHLGWAEALEVRGDSGRAREEAETARSLAREHGYGEIERRAAILAGSGLPTTA